MTWEEPCHTSLPLTRLHIQLLLNATLKDFKQWCLCKLEAICFLKCGFNHLALPALFAALNMLFIA